ETQESKGFAFVEAPTQDEMQAIIRRFDRAPLEDKLLRANPAQPTKPKDGKGPEAAVANARVPRSASGAGAGAGSGRRNRRGGRDRDAGPKSASATELAKAL